MLDRRRGGMENRGAMEKPLDLVSGFDYRVAQFQPQVAFRLSIDGWHAHRCWRQRRPGNDVRLAADTGGWPWVWPAES